MSALEQDQAESSQLLASITSCDVSDSLLKAKETSLVTYQRKSDVSYALFYLQRTPALSLSALQVAALAEHLRPRPDSIQLHST